ncbi:MAG: hypothetical protein ACI4JD_03155 [Ruminococcus sp.]
MGPSNSQDNSQDGCTGNVYFDCYKLNGNRVDRFVAATAYLSSSMPSVIMGRGYCTGMALTAYDVVGDKLVERWAFDTGHDSNVWLRCVCLMFFNKIK